MSGTFAAGALRLAGAAGVLLGWRPDEFWRATPTELAGILSPLAGREAAPASAEALRRLMEMYPDG